MRTLLLLLFTLLYFIGAHWFYTQKIPGICSGDAAVAIDGGANSNTGAMVPTIDENATSDDMEDLGGIAAETGPMSFDWSDETVETSEDFEDYKASILRGKTDNNILEITGQYYANEETPDGYENMGAARAAQVAELFKGDIPEERIITNSELLDDAEGMEDMPFEAIEFNWIAPVSSKETTVAEITENRTLIFYPFNSRVKDANPQVDEYLDRLAERIQETGEKVLITGHTDSTGDKQYNYDLGLQRAILIRNALVKRGAPRSKISVASKGETAPIASNRTFEGEHKNRRVVITIMGNVRKE